MTAEEWFDGKNAIPILVCKQVLVNILIPIPSLRVSISISLSLYIYITQQRAFVMKSQEYGTNISRVFT